MVFNWSDIGAEIIQSCNDPDIKTHIARDHPDVVALVSGQSIGIPNMI